MRLDEMVAARDDLLVQAARLDNLAAQTVGECADRLEWASQYVRLAAAKLAEAIASHCERERVPVPELVPHHRPDGAPYPSSC
jgi:hypothetical protein